jgi:ornithine cyclodeaminase/alanine dehydrogenase-like protein (mu-crystallin family)
MHVLSEAEVHQLLDPVQVCAAIENAFRVRYPTTLMPTRTQMKLADGVFLIMPCYDREGRGLGMKVVKFNNDPSVAEDRIQATYLLFDSSTGCSKLAIAANYLTDLRTAATSAVATKFLARPDSRVLGVFGTGRQARSHLQVLHRARKFERALVCGRDIARAQEFAAEMSHQLNLKVEAVYARTCAAESDVLCTCTTSATPLFDGHMLRPGTHINAVGAFQPHTRELDDTTMQRARIAVETFDAAEAEAGDLIIPTKAGRITRTNWLADLHQVVSGKVQVRTAPSEITVFKSVGCALEDLATAELLDAAQSTKHKTLPSTRPNPTPA